MLVIRYTGLLVLCGGTAYAVVTGNAALVVVCVLSGLALIWIGSRGEDE